MTNATKAYLDYLPENVYRLSSITESVRKVSTLVIAVTCAYACCLALSVGILWSVETITPSDMGIIRVMVAFGICAAFISWSLWGVSAFFDRALVLRCAEVIEHLSEDAMVRVATRLSAAGADKHGLLLAILFPEASSDQPCFAQEAGTAIA